MNFLQKITKRLDWHQKKWYASWHTWAGILAGTVLVVVGLTGVILVFENEIDVAMNPDMFDYQHQGKRLSFAEVTERAQEQYPDLNFLGVYRMEELNDVYQFNILQEGTKLQDKKFKQVFANPYTGNITGIRIYEHTFIGFIRKLHTSLLIPKIGNYLVGISSLTCLLLMITGLRLWVPKKWNQLSSKLKISVGKSAKRVNYDLHNTLGFYFSPIISMLALSGTMITFGQFFIMFLFILNFQSPAKLKEVFGQKSICTNNCKALDIASIDSIAVANFPKAKLTGIHFPENSTASYMVRMSEPSASELGSVLLVYIDSYSGNIQNHSNKEEFRLANAYFNWIDGIHFGKFGGWTTRILALVGSLMLVLLFVTGFIVWLPRWKKGKNYIKRISNGK